MDNKTQQMIDRIFQRMNGIEEAISEKNNMLFNIRDELVALSEKARKLQYGLNQLNTDQLENITEFQLLCEHLDTKPQGQKIPNKVAGDVPLARSAKTISMARMKLTHGFAKLEFIFVQPIEDRRSKIYAMDWWKNNERQYPVLSRLAREILNVPMSIVASKNAFIQKKKMPISRIFVGNLGEATKPDALKAALAEFISMIFFVFPAEGCVLLFTQMIKMDGQATLMITASLSHAFGFFVTVAVGLNISGDHVNPAVTFGAFVGSHITFFRSILYWIAQLLGSVAAIYLLKFATNVCGANILSGGARFGAVMNPAMAFCQAVISWTWTNHWVYWLGNFIGAAIAALVYQTILISHNTHE
ncbi:hypothetical protein FXO38_18090 [Capsicum annuum]|nr:hypothetical protein FXO38_18090 [Capsicum annuum]